MLNDLCGKKVEVYRWKWDTRLNAQGKELETTGVFLALGCNYTEFENGPGNFSTAIVKLEDGTLVNMPVELIRFI